MLLLCDVIGCYYWVLLQGAVSGCCFRVLLQDVVAECYCRMLLQSVIAGCYCRMLLQDVVAECYCRMLLQGDAVGCRDRVPWRFTMSLEFRHARIWHYLRICMCVTTRQWFCRHPLDPMGQTQISTPLSDLPDTLEPVSSIYLLQYRE